MPVTGRLPAATAVTRNVSGASAPPTPWEIRGATLQVATFEVDLDPMLDLTPDILSRPAPPYARILVADYPDSPVGPYREAQLLISTRFMMLPRQYLAASIVTSAAARDANLANWHYPSEVGEIDFRRNEDGFVSTIRGPGGLEIRLTSANAQEAGPAIIRYDPTVIVYAEGDEKPGLVTISAEPPSVAQAWLAVGTTVEYVGGDRNGPWLRLRSRNPITCTIALQEVLLPEPKAVRAPAAISAG
jgi:hypothetical protein